MGRFGRYLYGRGSLSRWKVTPGFIRKIHFVVIRRGWSTVLMEIQYRAALYMRLSKEDQVAGESGSILTQRRILNEYAKENGFVIYREYVDDGCSGTNFERIGFKQMLADILLKKVNLVIVKDLSRFGRDYIGAGEYLEKIFPLQSVRVIAINDGFDSLKKVSYQMLAIKNVFNEMYARDISDKITTSLKAKMQSGAYIGNFAPYGYQKDFHNKNKLVVNEETAPIVKQIFHWATQGLNPKKIAERLNCKQILAPLAYRNFYHTKRKINDQICKQGWNAATIGRILKNPVYLGHLVQGKTRKVSFKLKQLVPVDCEEWITVKNTHAALVSEEDFELIMQMRRNRTCHKQGSFFNLFSGVAFCKACGRRMSSVGSRKKDSPINLACGAYKAGGIKVCSNHFIEYRVLYDIVLQSLSKELILDEIEWASLVSRIKEKCRKKIEGVSEDRQVQRLERRGRALDALIGKLYEDYSRGFLTEVRLRKMVIQYEMKYREIQDVLQLRKHAENVPKDAEALTRVDKKILEYIERWKHLSALSPRMIANFIHSIEIGQGSYEIINGRRRKEQKIYLQFQFEK